MKEFNQTLVFDYPWDYVSAANWRKYPNKMSTHVVAVDVLNREFDPIQQTLLTERLIKCEQNIPSWLQVIIPNVNVSYVREVSIINLQNQTLTMRSINLTMKNLLKVYETVQYEPASDPNKTTFTQCARLSSNQPWIGPKIESWALATFAQNAAKGKMGFDSVLQLGLLPNLIEDLNNRKDDILDDIEKVSSKIIDEIKSCNAFKDINNISLDVLKDLTIDANKKLQLPDKDITDEILETLNLHRILVNNAISHHTSEIIRQLQVQISKIFSNEKD
ncbi:uncharacterized protein C5L36_0E04280 [Pichia kudriavzevii]|uniref:PRELI/MSF1 domain-containing protein n=1 Tax=Pichia kudriavzevii TaxID=4909 RepID=A0A099NTX6_PICKU|nr:uncharacterized protein C5L36_0E04280 [Pichia kudriavzevii]AWU78373.1 hypothetical protein C5L36_0E04280 [Pichia kudriavzevii]KGK36303.1 hypothetical protein JL09_g4542 [Pichia kudriavzevii]